MKVYHFKLTIEATFTAVETAYIDDTLQPLAVERRHIDRMGVVEYLSMQEDGGAEFETHLQLVEVSEEE